MKHPLLLTKSRKLLVWRQITDGNELNRIETCWLPSLQRHENSDIVISIVYRCCTHICHEIRELGTAFIVTGRSKFILAPSRCVDLRRIILENDGEMYAIVINIFFYRISHLGFFNKKKFNFLSLTCNFLNPYSGHS